MKALLYLSSDDRVLDFIVVNVFVIPVATEEAESIEEEEEEEEDVKPVLCDSDSFDEIDTLFLSYAGAFKKLSHKWQTMLKLDLAKIFARYEMKNAIEMENLEKLSPPKKKRTRKSNPVENSSKKNSNGSSTPQRQEMNTSDDTNDVTRVEVVPLRRTLPRFQQGSQQNTVVPNSISTPTLSQCSPVLIRPLLIPQPNAFIPNPTSTSPPELLPKLLPKPLPNPNIQINDSSVSTDNLSAPITNKELIISSNFKVNFPMANPVDATVKFSNATVEGVSQNILPQSTLAMPLIKPLFMSSETNAEPNANYTLASVPTVVLGPNLGSTQITLSDGTILEGIILQSDPDQEIVIAEDIS